MESGNIWIPTASDSGGCILGLQVSIILGID